MLLQGETLPDLNRLVRIGLDVDVAKSLRRGIANHKEKVSEALAGRLPEPSVQPKKKRVTSRRRTNATGAGRRAGKTQQVKRPLRRSARMHQTTGSETAGNDVYTFRGDSEGAPDAEATNGGSSSSDGRYSGSSGGLFGSKSSSYHGFNTTHERSPVGSEHRISASRQSDPGCIATQGGGTGSAADCSPPRSMETSAAEGGTQVFGQPTEAMNLLDESFFTNFGADMAVTEAAAAPPPMGIPRQENAYRSTAALLQLGQQVSFRRAAAPKPGLLASETWRRMAQNALGIVNLLLAPEPSGTQAGLGMPPLQHGWMQQGQVAIR